ncbi:MAG: TlpA disulfide reductase family protein [Bacteroidales bacterium]|nr:TlpA disulfide reductase family protein [Bacteroidales bacterium]
MRTKFFSTIMLLIFALTYVDAKDNTSKNDIDKSKIQRILGQWSDKSSNEWKYGFFENFVVCDNEFWEYDNVKIKANKGTIKIKNGKKSKSIDLLFLSNGDSICQISAEKGSKSDFIKRKLPVLPSKSDSRNFAADSYKIDSATVSGVLTNRITNDDVEVCVNGFIKNETFKAKIDSLGRFSIRIPLFGISNITIDWKNSRIKDVIEPNENYFIYKDWKTEVAWIMGQNWAFHTEMQNFKLPSQCVIPEYNEIKGRNKAYLDTCTHITTRRKAYLDAYIAKNNNLSSRFIDFQTRNVEYDLANALMKRKFSLNSGYSEELPRTYLDIVKLSIKNMPDNFLMYDNLLEAVNNYSDYMQHHDMVNINVNTIELIKYWNRKGEFDLTKEQKRELLLTQKGVDVTYSLLYSGADSSTIALRTQIYDEYIKNIQPLLDQKNVTDFISSSWAEKGEEIVQNNDILDYVENVDSLGFKPNVKELLIYKKSCELFQNQKKPVFESTLALLKDNVKNQFLSNDLSEKQKYFQNAEKKSDEYVQNLKMTDNVSQMKTYDELFKSLIEPYKGKVIYIDFWGSWCSPCRQEMTFAAELKRNLENKDVVFMYFANKTKEEDWKNFIKEFRIVGNNVVHYNLPEEQQRILERRFIITSFPTYLIIDKDGNIGSMAAGSPSKGMETVKEIESYL